MSLGFESFSEFLINRFKHSLPGAEAQLSMAPINRPPDTLKAPFDTDAKISSVVLLIYPHLGQPNLVLIERNTYDGVHSGQMGLPGGKKEESDLDLASTALREAGEELGIVKHAVNLIGMLTPLYIPVSKFLVHPFIGLMNDTPTFTPDPREVAGFISVHPAVFVEPDYRALRKVSYGAGLSKEVPSFVIQEKVIWGATAMILGEFSEFIKPFFKNQNKQ
jgi:8-oxo-dGTP pyrophosphatase MutT (NUDIX family)